MNRLSTFLIAAAALVLVAGPPPARATVKVVTISNAFAFSPTSVTVTQGDTVRWMNNGIYTHTATSGTYQPGCTVGNPDGIWASGELGPSAAFQRRFNDPPGDYAYFCSHHACCCSMSGVVHVVAPVGVGESEPGVRPARLLQNYPNPFNPETWIPFELSRETRVQLAVYDVEGRQIAVLVSGVLGNGSYSVPWRGVDGEGREVPSGSYFAKLRFGKDTEVRKMILSK